MFNILRSSMAILSTMSLMLLVEAIPTTSKDSGPGDWPNEGRREELIVPTVVLHAPVDSPSNVLQLYPGAGATFFDQAVPAKVGAQLNQYDVDRSEGGPVQLFDFIPVSSQFMRYDNSACLNGHGTCYGHLRVHSSPDPKAPLVISVAFPGEAVNQKPSLDTESLSDDSGQLLQFWSYDLSSYELQFLGIALNRTGDPTYKYDGPYGAAGPKGSGGPVVLVKQNEAEGFFAFQSL